MEHGLRHANSFLRAQYILHWLQYFCSLVTVVSQLLRCHDTTEVDYGLEGGERRLLVIGKALPGSQLILATWSAMMTLLCLYYDRRSYGTRSCGGHACWISTTPLKRRPLLRHCLFFCCLDLDYAIPFTKSFTQSRIIEVSLRNLNSMASPLGTSDLLNNGVGFVR